LLTLLSDAHLGAASQPEIADFIMKGASVVFPGATLSVYLVDPTTTQLTHTQGPATLSQTELSTVFAHVKQALLASEGRQGEIHLYIPQRSHTLWHDKAQHNQDKAHYQTPCQDLLCHPIVSQDELILGLVTVHHWTQPLSLQDYWPDFQDRIGQLKAFVHHTADWLDTHLIHQKIESLLATKRELKQKIRQDGHDLNQRVKELSVLYDVSTALADSVNTSHMLDTAIAGLGSVLGFDVCAVLRLDHPRHELRLHMARSLPPSLLESVTQNVLKAAYPLTHHPIQKEECQIHLHDVPSPVTPSTMAPPSPTLPPLPSDAFMRSFTNVPLVHKNAVIGILHVCTTQEHAYQRNEITFIHTLANQLATHLGRLQLSKKIEWLRMESMVNVMPDGVIMTNANGRVELFNTAAATLLGATTHSATQVAQQLQAHPVGKQLVGALADQRTVINEELKIEDRYCLVNISPIPVLHDPDAPKGALIIIRDCTEVQKSNRIKAQRLDILSQAGMMIKSITNIENLLGLLMELILNTIQAELGSIQLISQGHFQTKVHGNFPDKIRRDYRFTSGETITEYVARVREPLFIPDYQLDANMVQSVKISIDCYIAIPIMVKSELIGMVSIARKLGTTAPPITQDDIRTLVTITSFSATAIQNALMYQDTLKTQRLDQEVKIAADIQAQLLPSRLPEVVGYDFAAHSLPAREIGGDYYDFFELPNGKIGITVADIVGKGIPAGLFMAMLKSLLHSTAMIGDPPSKTMNRLNSSLAKDPVMNRFVPMFYGVLDPQTGVFSYVNAGIEPILHLSDQLITPLPNGGIPLGALDDAHYEENIVHLAPGDMIVCHTDGLTDAKSPLGSRFSQDRLIQTLGPWTHYTASALTQALLQALRDFARRDDLSDDVTISVIRRAPIEDEATLPTGHHVSRLVISSSPSDVKVVRRHVEQLCHTLGFSDEETFNIKLSINEAQANVIEHAYRGSHTGKMIVTFVSHHDQLDIIIRDFGGHESQSIKGASHLDELEGSGLGLFLINTFMDKVQYKRMPGGGTELVLTKYLPPKTEPAT